MIINIVNSFNFLNKISSTRNSPFFLLLHFCEDMRLILQQRLNLSYNNQCIYRFTALLLTMLSRLVAVKYTWKEDHADTDVTIFYARMRAMHSHFVFTLITNIYRNGSSRLSWHSKMYTFKIDRIHSLVSRLWLVFCKSISAMMQEETEKERIKSITFITSKADIERRILT